MRPDSICNPEARVRKIVTLTRIVPSADHTGDANPIHNPIIGLSIGKGSQIDQLPISRHREKPTVARAENALTFERPRYGLEGIGHLVHESAVRSGRSGNAVAFSLRVMA